MLLKVENGILLNTSPYLKSSYIQILSTSVIISVHFRFNEDPECINVKSLDSRPSGFSFFSFSSIQHVHGYWPTNLIMADVFVELLLKIIHGKLLGKYTHDSVYHTYNAL